jgi:hypothetical protein
VRGPKHVVRCGQTPALAEEQAPCLVDIIDTSIQPPTARAIARLLM